MAGLVHHAMWTRRIPSRSHQRRMGKRRGFVAGGYVVHQQGRMAKAKQSLELIAAEAMGASNHVCAQAVQMKAEKEKANVMAMAALREVVMLKEKIVQMQRMQRPSFDNR